MDSNWLCEQHRLQMAGVYYTSVLGCSHVLSKQIVVVGAGVAGAGAGAGAGGGAGGV